MRFKACGTQECSASLLHLPYFVLFLQLKVDVEMVLFLPLLFSKEQVTIPHGPLMSLPLMHVSVLFARLETPTLGHLQQ